MNKTGCGIGLYISQQIISKMGSQIRVKSTPNKGTVFFFELPISQDEDIVERTESEGKFMRERLTKTSKDFAVRRSTFLPRNLLDIEEEEKVAVQEESSKPPASIILLVDDQPMNLVVLKLMLDKKLDRNVKCFYSGYEAIQGLKAIMRDQTAEGGLRLLVLMDINMPDMDGFETTHIMKELLSNQRNV